MVAARYKAQLYWLSLSGIAGSNTAEGMDVSIVGVVCCQVEGFATGQYLV
jgi:hypothetical protein